MILILFVDHDKINYYWVFVLVDSLLILYGCVFDFFFFLLIFCLPQLEILGLSRSGVGLEVGVGTAWRLAWVWRGMVRPALCASQWYVYSKWVLGLISDASRW